MQLCSVYSSPNYLFRNEIITQLKFNKLVIIVYLSCKSYGEIHRIYNNI